MKLKKLLFPGVSLALSLAVGIGALCTASSGQGNPTNSGGNRPSAVLTQQTKAIKAANAQKAAQTATYPAGVSSEKDFAFAKENYRNAYEKLMAEDGFLYGMEYDWIADNMDFSCSLGDNEILTHDAAYSEAKCAIDLYNIKALGFNAVNMWLLQGGQGLNFDHDTGYVTGLDESLKNNLISFLNIARKNDLKVVLSIQPHGIPGYGDTIDKLSYEDLRTRYFQFYYSEPARKAYMDNAIKPLCNDIIRLYQDTVIICDLTVENGANEVNDDDLGMYCWTGGTTWENFASFVSEMNKCVKEAMPNMMTSSEDMFYQYAAYKYNDLGLDLHGYNWYNKSGTIPDTAALFSNTPLYISEVNVTEDKSESFSDEYWQQAQMQYYTNAQAQGYIGCFYFSWWVGAGNFVMFDESTLKYESMKNVAQHFYYQFNDMKNKYRGVENAVDKPVLLSNRGGSEVYWLPGRTMERFQLDRSDDGGKTWKTVAANLRDGEGCTMLKNGLIKYIDTTVGAGMSYQYRVTAFNDETGVSSVSVPNNRAEFFVAQNLVKNGDFEETDSFNFPQGTIQTAEADKGWYTNGRQLGVISTRDAQSGSKCIEIDTTDGKGQTGWTKLFQKLTVTPGALYEASYWYKNVDTDKGIALQASGVDDSVDGLYINGTYQHTPENPDDEWHKASFIFTAPADGQVIIRLWNSDWGYQKGLVDNVQVLEIR